MYKALNYLLYKLIQTYFTRSLLLKLYLAIVNKLLLIIIVNKFSSFLIIYFETYGRFNYGMKNKNIFI